MATINLGSIKFNWQGAYAGGTAYAVDDVVSYNGSSYICILASTGNLPTNATYFEQMSQAGTDLTSTLTTQGDILYRDGSGLQRLGAGTSGQVLQTGGTGANPSWTDSSGGILQVKNDVITSNYLVTGTTQQVIWTGDTLTLASTSSKVWLKGDFGLGGKEGGTLRLDFSSDGGTSWSALSFADIGDTDTNQNNGNAILGWHFNPTGSVADYTVMQHGFNYLHSPSSTSAKYRLSASSSSTGYTFGVNRRHVDSSWRALSYMTTMEVGV